MAGQGEAANGATWLIMNKSAVILSKAEAMALPLHERPLCYRLPESVYTAIWELMGAASMCWNPRPTGVFDAEQASQFATELCFKIANEMEKIGWAGNPEIK